MANKILTSFRLAPETKAEIKKLAQTLGVSEADIVEMALREFIKKQKRKDKDE